MKKIITFFLLISTAALYNTTAAQDDKRKDKETEEIIIRKKGDKDTDLVVEIKGDKITVNGKPLSEFNDANVTIKKGRITVRDKDKMIFDFNDKDWARGWEEQTKRAIKDAHIQLRGVEGHLKGLSEGWEEGNMVSKAFLGVTTHDDEDGAEITKVTEGSAADKAGLKTGDIITKIDDKDVEDPSSLSEIINSYKPKDKVKISYKRDGKEKTTKATLGETKNTMSFAFRTPEGIRRHPIPPVPPVPPVPGAEMWDGHDFNFSPHAFEGDNNTRIFTHPRHQKLGLKIQDTEDGSGIKVLGTDKDSPAEKAGLKEGDIVTEIAGEKVTTTDDAREQLRENHGKSSYTIKAKRNGTEMNFEVKIPKKLKTADL